MIAKDLRQFLKRLGTMLAVLARDGQHVQLKTRFEDYHKLLEAWLDIAPPESPPPDRLRFLSLVDRFGGPLEIDMYEIARAAALSDDSSTVVVVADQILHGAFACLRQDQPRLMEDLLKALVHLYYQCIDRKDLANAIGHRLDSGLHSLFFAMRSRNFDTSERDEANPSDTATLDAILRFSIELTHAAIRHEQNQHATFFVERIFEHRKHRHRHQIPNKPVVLEPEVLFDYVAIVLAGWALHILRSNVPSNPDAARAVLNAALAQVPSAPVLLAEWELLRGAEWHNAAIDSRLGISHWDLRDWKREFRSGVGEVRPGGPDWVRLGFRASLLHSDDRFIGDASQLFSGQPRRFTWDAAEERKALLLLSVDPWINIREADRQKRVDSVMQIIEQRARGSDAEYLRYVLNSTLSASRLTQFREDALNAFLSKQSWQGSLRQAGLSGNQPRLCPRRTRRGILVPREYLLDNHNWASGFGEELGKTVAVQEAMAVIHLIETLAQRAGDLGALSSLPEKMRDLRRLMTDAGYEPNVIILPREERFAGALFQKPLWQVEGRNEFGEASIGLWEQLHVLRFPYKNSESIVLLDTRCLVAENELDHGVPVTRVWIEESSSIDDIESKKSSARDALNSADLAIPESSSIQVEAWMEAVPRLGLIDTSAARAIDIRGSDANFVNVEGSNLYHRPTCPDIVGEKVTLALSVNSDDGKEPCPTCRPDRWNLEGRSSTEGTR